MIFLVGLLLAFSAGNLIEINKENFSEYTKNRDIVLVNYYAVWCPFSQQMKAVLATAAELLNARSDIPNASIAAIDCTENADICANHGINKYPTTILYARGVTVGEYRGNRNTENVLDWLKDSATNKSFPVASQEELEKLKLNGTNFLIGFFSETVPDELVTFCGHFFPIYVALNLQLEMYTGESLRYYRTTDNKWLYFPGKFTDYADIGEWIKKVTHERLREMTFQNAEEITDLRKSLFVLFHNKEDTSSLDLYRQQIETLLHQVEEKVSFIHVDCKVFEHPLAHVGKGPFDCPLFIIDSLSHMFLYTGDIEFAFKHNITEFVTYANDFFSGKLHKKMHYMDVSEDGDSADMFGNSNHNSNEDTEHVSDVVVKESKFKNLAPSISRYSFTDEL